MYEGNFDKVIEKLDNLIEVFDRWGTKEWNTPYNFTADTFYELCAIREGVYRINKGRCPSCNEPVTDEIIEGVCDSCKAKL